MWSKMIAVNNMRYGGFYIMFEVTCQFTTTIEVLLWMHMIVTHLFCFNNIYTCVWLDCVSPNELERWIRVLSIS